MYTIKVLYHALPRGAADDLGFASLELGRRRRHVSSSAELRTPATTAVTATVWQLACMASTHVHAISRCQCPRARTCVCGAGVLPPRVPQGPGRRDCKRPGLAQPMPAPDMVFGHNTGRCRVRLLHSQWCTGAWRPPALLLGDARGFRKGAPTGVRAQGVSQARARLWQQSCAHLRRQILSGLCHCRQLARPQARRRLSAVAWRPRMQPLLVCGR